MDFPKFVVLESFPPKKRQIEAVRTGTLLGPAYSQGDTLEGDIVYSAL